MHRSVGVIIAFVCVCVCVCVSVCLSVTTKSAAYFVYTQKTKCYSLGVVFSRI